MKIAVFWLRKRPRAEGKMSPKILLEKNKERENRQSEEKERKRRKKATAALLVFMFPPRRIFLWAPRDYNLGQSKMDQQTPIPPNQRWSRPKAKTHYFPILDSGGEWGTNFPSTILSKIVACSRRSDRRPPSIFPDGGGTSVYRLFRHWGAEVKRTGTG